MADTRLPAPPQPPPAAKRRKGDPRLPLFIAACYGAALNKPHSPARWYVRLSRFGAGEQLPLFPAEVGR